MSAFVWRRAHTVVAAATAAVLVVAGIGFAATRGQPGVALLPTSTTAGPESPTPSPSTSKPPKAKPVDPLTGGRVNDRPVIAVKLENIAAARPQVGLSPADIVFIEEVEGAQTRLVAVYHSKFPDRLGPVRSARNTDVQLLPLFGKPGLVYSGANTRVQRNIDAASIVSIPRSTRDNSRIAPHNVFVDLAKIAKSERLAEAQPIGWAFATKVSGDAAKAHAVKTQVGNDTFRFDYGSGRYTVRWRGERYADGDSGAVTRADNVVIMKVRNRADGNRDVMGSASVLSETVGHGKVSIYRDGRRITGTWRRNKDSGPLRFRDADGQVIPLKPGQTWVALAG
ncbi:MAG TPA: DUF3048 domain-containing protein [Propionibacteriaceae bacterium]|nr:DUF3048 domain-containing protein [Propionibacteriaceae bacterium]